MAGFQDIYGQEAMKEHLQNAIRLGKVSHAYIINGERNSGKEFIARIFARALHKNKHSAVIDLLTGKIKSAAAAYPDRNFGNEADQQLKSLLSKAGKMQEKLARDGIHAEILREEPSTTDRDSMDFQVFLMVWKKGWRNRKVEIQKL